MQSILSFILVLGSLIFIHEFGHFLFARLLGVRVQKFSIGFGPKIIGKKIGDTEYVISAIPLGGFVKMLGESPVDSISEEDKKVSFSHKSVWKRIVIVAAGPIANFVLAIIILFFLFLNTGQYKIIPEIGEVQTNSPAYKAGILKGDIITFINNKKINKWSDVRDAVELYASNKISIDIKRSGENLNFKIIPKTIKDKNIFGETINRHIIGITASGASIHEEISIMKSWQISKSYTYEMSKLTFKHHKIISREIRHKKYRRSDNDCKDCRRESKKRFF